MPDSAATSSSITADPEPTSASVPGAVPGQQDPTAFGCRIGPVPASAGLDPFYAQGCSLDGLWVVGAKVVDPEAITRAAALVAAFLKAEPRLAASLAGAGVRLGVIGVDQRTTDMPEYRDLYQVFPEIDWDERARGLGATDERPLVSVGEENLLCLASDRYRGEDILLHEVAHLLDAQGYSRFDPAFHPALQRAYRQARQNGTWTDTYASENAAEYWAEGVQSYFDRNLSAEIPDGIHGPIDTRDELARADPDLFRLIDDRLSPVELPPRCQDS